MSSKSPVNGSQTQKKLLTFLQIEKSLTGVFLFDFDDSWRQAEA